MSLVKKSIKCFSSRVQNAKRRLLEYEASAPPPSPTQKLQALIHAVNFLRPSDCLSLPEPAKTPECAETQMLDSMAHLCARSDDCTVALVAESRISELGTRSLSLIVATNDPARAKIVGFLKSLIATMRSVAGSPTQSRQNSGLFELRIVAMQYTFERFMSRLMRQYNNLLVTFGAIERKCFRTNDPLLAALKAVTAFKDFWQRDEPLQVTFWQSPDNARRLWREMNNMRIKLIKGVVGIKAGRYHGMYQDSHKLDLETYLIQLIAIPQDIYDLGRRAQNPIPSLKDYFVNPARIRVVPSDHGPLGKRGKAHPWEWFDLIVDAYRGSMYRRTKVLDYPFLRGDCKRMTKNMPRKKIPVDAECNMVVYLLDALGEGPGQCKNYMALSRRPSKMTLFWIQAFNSSGIRVSNTPVRMSFSCTQFNPRGGSIGGMEPPWTLPHLGGDLQEGVVRMMGQGIWKAFAATYAGFQDRERVLTCKVRK